MTTNRRQENARAAEVACRDREVVLGSLPVEMEAAFEGGCNARCVFCLSHGPVLDTPKAGPRDVLPDAFLEEMLPSLERLSWSCWNECLVSERFLDVLCDPSPRPSISLLTNGLLLHERAALLLDSPKPMEINVSLHAATAATHSRLVGCPPSRFPQIVETLREMVRRRDAERLPKRFFLVFVVTRSNVGEMADFVRLALDIGVDRVRLRGLEMMPFQYWRVERDGVVFDYDEELRRPHQAEIDAQLAEVRRLLAEAGRPDDTLALEMGPRPPLPLRGLFAAARRLPVRGLVRRFRAGRYGSWEGSVPPAVAAALAGARLALPGRRGTFACPRPWDTVVVDEKGNVRFCLQNWLMLGNVHEQPFAAIWNGPRAQRLRRLVAAGRVPGVCAGCRHVTEAPIRPV